MCHILRKAEKSEKEALSTKKDNKYKKAHSFCKWSCRWASKSDWACKAVPSCVRFLPPLRGWIFSLLTSMSIVELKYCPNITAWGINRDHFDTNSRLPKPKVWNSFQRSKSTTRTHKVCKRKITEVKLVYCEIIYKNNILSPQNPENLTNITNCSTKSPSH